MAVAGAGFGDVMARACRSHWSRAASRGTFGPVSPDDVRELAMLWRERLSGDDGLGRLRKQGGITAWYRRLATVREVALAVAEELARERKFKKEVEDLPDFLEALRLPPDDRRKKLAKLQLDGNADWAEAVRICELSSEQAESFDAWYARAQEITRGPQTIDPMGIGAIVTHATFGEGTITAKQGDTLTITFASGEKRIQSRFIKPT